MRDMLEMIVMIVIGVPLAMMVGAIICALAVIIGSGLAIAIPIAALMGKPMKITVTKKDSE